nr:protein-glutamate O-methyltransferase CheR [Bdellovibrionales bacterium]
MFSDKERALIFKLVEELTGATQTGDTRQDSLISNVERRMQDLGLPNLAAYLQYVEKNPGEVKNLVSALTIHTTSWFRENPHFVAFQKILLEALNKDEVFKVWCAACSTGEEVYSFALLLEEFRRVHPKFDYEVYGTDIDSVSIAVAERAIYQKKHMGFHVIRYKNHILEGSGKTEDFFTLSKEIRDRCTFYVNDLRSAVLQTDGPFHVCICRNVLIYFSPTTVGRVISNLLMNVRGDGYLMLGHSEAINGAEFGISQLGHSVYTKKNIETSRPRSAGKYRVLSIDDSLSTRKYLEKAFTEMGF